MVKTLLLLWWAWIQSLVGDLRSHMQHGRAKKKKKQRKLNFLSLLLTGLALFCFDDILRNAKLRSLYDEIGMPELVSPLHIVTFLHADLLVWHDNRKRPLTVPNCASHRLSGSAKGETFLCQAEGRSLHWGQDPGITVLKTLPRWVQHASQFKSCVDEISFGKCILVESPGTFGMGFYKLI